jgi:hypothetical protein
VITARGYDNIEFRLVTKAGEPVALDSELTDFRGDTATLVSARPPHKPASSGFVYVETEDDRAEYYPSVFGLKWEKIE